MKKQRARKRDRVRRLSFVIAVTAIVIVGCLASWLLLAKGEVSFEEAMKKPELRDGYIEKMVEKIGKPEYVTVVNYDDTPEEMEFLRKEYGYTPAPDDLMATHVSGVKPEFFGKQSFPVRISVFPFAFSGGIIKTEADFISTLLHEYFHAENAQRGKTGSLEIFSSFLTIDGRWNKDLFLDIDEMGAISWELATQTKISHEYQLNRMGRYLDHYCDIWDHSQGMEPGFIKILKIEFFEPWIVNTPFLFKESGKAEEIWYLKHPQTGRKYYLPEEVIRKFSQNGKG